MAGVGPKIQLAAVGAQDVGITFGSEPEPPWTWRQYTNFATSEQEVPFPTDMAFGETSVVTFPFSMADVLGPLYLDVTLPALGGGLTWCPYVGFMMLRRVQLLAGNVLTDDLDGLYHLLATRLHLTAGRQHAVARMAGAGPLPADVEHHLLVPLALSFTAPGGPGLPLVAMTASKLQLTLALQPLESLVAGPPPGPAPPLRAVLLVQATLLTREERAGLLTRPQTVLTERVLGQVTSSAVTTNNHDVLARQTLAVDLMFMQGAVKQVMLVLLAPDGTPVDALQRCSLFVNNVERGDARVGQYFSAPSAFRRCASCPADPIYTLNFGLCTSSSQPSGVLDMDKVASCFLQLDVDAGLPLEVRVYATAFKTLAFRQGVVTAGDPAPA